MIYNQFIREHADDVIPLPNELRDSVRQALTHPSRAMFNEAQREIFAVMEEGSFEVFKEHELFSKCKGHLLRKFLRDDV